MTHLTAPRATFAAALLALSATVLAPSTLVAFYLTAIAAAGLIGAGFLAYLQAVDEPSRRRLIALACTVFAAALVMTQAAIDFPATLGAEPLGTGSLAQASLGLASLALLTELPSTLPARIPRLDPAQLRELLSR